MSRPHTSVKGGRWNAEEAPYGMNISDAGRAYATRLQRQRGEMWSNSAGIWASRTRREKVCCASQIHSSRYLSDVIVSVRETLAEWGLCRGLLADMFSVREIQWASGAVLMPKAEIKPPDRKTSWPWFEKWQWKNRLFGCKQNVMFQMWLYLQR